jgi:predicted RNA-binding Zn ribbon-like protein
VAWAQQVGLLSDGEAQQLLQGASHRPEDAAAILERAIDLREAMYRTFSAVAGNRPVEAADIALLNKWLKNAQGQLQLVTTDTGFTWQWAGDGTSLRQMLWPIARSAAELLVSEDLNQVKECADDRGCGWLFLDTSRNQRRRWCSMESCGNRAKVRRHRHKQTAEK